MYKYNSHHSIPVIHFSQIKSNNHTFIIFDTPNDVNLPLYINSIIKNGPHATVWIHACEKLYDDEKLIESGVSMYDLRFDDGKAPSPSILDSWSKILISHRNEVIAIHCVAGLGRAPCLVAIALIEDGWTVIDAVTEIRKQRSGALNIPQLKFIQSYRRSRQRIPRCLLL